MLQNLVGEHVHGEGECPSLIATKNSAGRIMPFYREIEIPALLGLTTPDLDKLVCFQTVFADPV